MLPYFHPIPALPESATLELATPLSWLLFALTLVVTLFAIGVLNVWAYRARQALATQMESVFVKRFLCPVKGYPVEVDFLTRGWDPRALLKVKRCSAFPHGAEADCDHACLRSQVAQLTPVLVAPPYYHRLPLL